MCVNPESLPFLCIVLLKSTKYQVTPEYYITNSKNDAHHSSFTSLSISFPTWDIVLNPKQPLLHNVSDFAWTLYEVCYFLLITNFLLNLTWKCCTSFSSQIKARQFKSQLYSFCAGKIFHKENIQAKTWMRKWFLTKKIIHLLKYKKTKRFFATRQDFSLI